MPKGKTKVARKKVFRKRRATNKTPAATVSDILGARPATTRVNPKWRRHYERLLDLRDALRDSKESLFTGAREEVVARGTHPGDTGTDNYDRDLALSLASSEQNAIYEIEDAINRIRNGTYGTCELTGKRIEAARLNAIPWTRFSTEAKKRLEKENSDDRTRFTRRVMIT